MIDGEVTRDSVLCYIEEVMRAPDLQTEGLEIVLVGKFNPQIFQPYWFAKNDLIPAGEAESATIGLVHPDVCDFKLDWCHLNVGPERLTLDTKRPERYPPLFDLLASTFTLLCHTPITAVGINRKFVYRFSSDENWHNFGHRLAPKDPWTEALEKPGLMALNMKGLRTDSFEGSINVYIQGGQPREITLLVNDHFQLSVERQKDFRLGDFLDSQRKVSMDRAEKIANLIVYE
jgi:hypothetical protein